MKKSKKTTMIFMKSVFIGIIVFQNFNVLANVKLEGPDNACPTSTVTVKEKGGITANEWSYACSNCEFWIPSPTNQWLTYFEGCNSGCSGPNSFIDELQVRVGSNGSASLTVYKNDIPGPSDIETHNITIGAPGLTGSNLLSGSNQLTNCGVTRTWTTDLPDDWFAESWSVSSGLDIVSSNSSSISFKADNSSITGTESVTAVFEWEDSGFTSCGAESYSENISVVNATLNIEGPTGICSGGNALYAARIGAEAVGSFPGATYSWSVPSGWQILGSSISASVNVYVPSNIQSGGVLSVNITTPSCGNPSGGRTVYSYSCSGMTSFAVTPNPASYDEASLLIETDDDHTFENNNIELAIFKDTGNKEAMVKVNNKETSLKAYKLKKGVYFVELYVNGKQFESTKRLVIK